MSYSYDAVSGIRLVERAQLHEGAGQARAKAIDLCVRIGSLARDLDQLCDRPSAYTNDELAEAAAAMDDELELIRAHITELKVAIRHAQQNEELGRGF